MDKTIYVLQEGDYGKIAGLYDNEFTAKNALLDRYLSGTLPGVIRCGLDVESVEKHNFHLEDIIDSIVNTIKKDIDDLIDDNYIVGCGNITTPPFYTTEE